MLPLRVRPQAGFAEAQVSRRLDVKLKKLGGGKLKFTVKGASPVTVYVLDSYGYEISGIKPKRANKAGVAILSLGNRHRNSPTTSTSAPSPTSTPLLGRPAPHLQALSPGRGEDDAAAGQSSQQRRHHQDTAR